MSRSPNGIPWRRRWNTARKRKSSNPFCDISTRRLLRPTARGRTAQAQSRIARLKFFHCSLIRFKLGKSRLPSFPSTHCISDLLLPHTVHSSRRRNARRNFNRTLDFVRRRSGWTSCDSRLAQRYICTCESQLSFPGALCSTNDRSSASESFPLASNLLKLA